MKHLLIALFSMIFIGQLSAAEQVIQTLGNGSCWYENAELFKVASFNDKSAYGAVKSQLEDNLLEAIATQARLKKTRESAVHSLGLHCGGYGSSLIARFEVEGAQFCAWFRFDRSNGLVLRSLGGSEVEHGDYCDGYVVGQLLIGLKNKDQKTELEKERFRPFIKKVESVTDGLVKVSLADEYVGKETEAMTELKNELDLRYIELNLLQHQVGEFTSLK